MLRFPRHLLGLRNHTPSSCGQVDKCRRSIHAAFIIMKQFNFMEEVRQVQKLDKKLINLDESDVVETHIHGWGPGGQKKNKTANCVALTHTPTGITVKCQSSRSLVENAKIARARLRMKVDVHVKGEESILVQKTHQQARNKSSKTAKTKENLELKKKLKHIIESDKAGAGNTSLNA